MKTNAEINALVAEALGGSVHYCDEKPEGLALNHCVSIPNYCEDIKAAWELVEHMKMLDDYWIGSCIGGYGIWADPDDDNCFVMDESISKAIALAFLKARGVEVG